MNFLAHIYLSGEQKDLLIGNFIGDFVKGKAFEEYSSDIRKGILLHREIDQFTDSHEIVNQSKMRLRPKYRHYSPVIVDVFYDHFLASLWSNYHPEPLASFTDRFYKLTHEYEEAIPEKAQFMLTYMERDDWLFNYQFKKGIGMALTGMSRRTPYHSKMELAVEDLSKHYDLYRSEFESFFPELIDHVKNKLLVL